MIPLAVLQTYVLRRTTAEIRAREQQNAAMSLDRVYRTLEAQFLGVVTLANAGAADAQIIKQLTTRYATPNDYYAEYFDSLRPKITRYLSAYMQQVHSIELYVDNPTILSGGHCMRIEDPVRAAPWYAAPGSQPRLQAYFKTNYAIYLEQPQLSVVRTFATERPEPEKFLKIDLNMDPIYRAIDQEKQYLTLYLVSPEGWAVTHTGSVFEPNQRSKWAYAPAHSDLQAAFGAGTVLGGWQLMAQVNTEPMEQGIRDTVLSSMALGVGCGLLAALMAYIIAESFIGRSRKLLLHMDAVAEGQFVPIGGPIGGDEIGELILHYNDMSGRLEQLIRDVYALELQKKDFELERVRAELKYLQAQIDPHFLFNTLNAILVVCVKNQYGEVSEVIRALAKILRRMADASDDLIPLATEVDFTRMYLEIERFRFGEKLTYTLDIPAEAQCIRLPKMCLQSLVENACKHGVQHVAGQGRIDVTARLESGLTGAADMLLLEVRDNGAGIPAGRLRNIREDLAQRKDNTGSIGLQNIRRRLALYYGSAAELTLESTPAEGTAVLIRMPAVQEGGAADVLRDASR